MLFQDHTNFLPFHFPKVRDELLNNDGIVRSPSVGHKTCLDRINEVGKNRLDSIDNNFCDKLI